MWLPSSNFPPSSPYSHLWQPQILSLFLWDCFWVIIDLMLVSVIQHRLKISIHFKMITMITLVTICHYTKISHNWLYSPHCTFHTHDSLILEPKVCTSEFPSLVFSPFPHPLWQPSVCSLHLCLSFCLLTLFFRFHIQVTSYSICLCVARPHWRLSVISILQSPSFPFLHGWALA